MSIPGDNTRSAAAFARGPWIDRLGVFAVSFALVLWFGAEAPPGLALDDAYIHASHARNLAERGAVELLPGNPSHAVTSPLWTLLLAGAGAAMGDVLGAAGLLALFVLPLLSLGVLELTRSLGYGRVAGLGAALLAASTGPLLWLNASGMESVLFCALLVWGAWAAVADRPFAFGCIAGLALLVRVEGFVLLIAYAMSSVGRPRAELARVFVRAAVPVALIMTAFCAYNLIRVGHPLPGTLAAKRFGHGAGRLSLWEDARILVFGWIGYFRVGLAPTGSWAVLGWPMALVVPLAVLAKRTPLRGRGAALLLLLFLGVNGAYVLLLPAQGGAGRYQIVNWLVPALLLPAGLAAGAGWAFAGRRPGAAAALVASLLAAFVGHNLAAAGAWRQGLAAHVAQISGAHGRIGRELSQRNVACSPILAYDVGAISYFLETRRCQPAFVDLGGLADPKLLPSLKAPNAVQRLVLENGGVAWLALPTTLDGAPLHPPVGLRTVGAPGRRQLLDPAGVIALRPVAASADTTERPYRWLVAGNAPRVALWDVRATPRGRELMEKGPEAVAALARGPADSTRW